MTKTYQKAFTEVYEILNYLDDESYNKIPKNIIKAIEENRDMEYEYFIDESILFIEQEMLDETKAILFNLYKDYLTTIERKKKIIEYQNEEIKILEEEKRKKYNFTKLFNKEKKSVSRASQENCELIKYKEHWYDKVKKFFHL